MRTIVMLFIVGLLLSLTVPSMAQDRVIVTDLGTVANSVNETGYVYFGNDWQKIDSVSVTIVASGELDMDSLTLYKANFDPDKGVWYKDVSVLGNFTITLNLADGVKDLEQLYSSNATLLTGASLRGINGVYYLTRGATSGNDATDTGQHAKILWHIWGLKNP